MTPLRFGTRLLLFTCLTVLLLPSSGRSQGSDRTDIAIHLHAGALAQLIDEVGGRPVVVTRSRVLAVINRQTLLVESASTLRPMRSHFDRVVVFVAGREISASAGILVGSNVNVFGTARTLAGMQVTSEAPWPQELTPAIVERYGIRAAVLATSVRTTDGVELTRPQA